jgi:stage IV sporulation protein B
MEGCGRVNSRKRKYRQVLSIITAFTLLALGVFVGREFIEYNLPNNINIIAGEENNLGFKLPISIDITQCEQGTLRISNEDEDESSYIDLRKEFTVPSSQTGNYKLEFKMFGIFRLKSVEFSVVENKEVYALGIPSGMIINTDGVLTLGTGIVKGDDGIDYEPCKNRIEVGDYIIKVNNKTIQSKEELIKIVESEGNKDVVISIRRDGEIKNVIITPALSKVLGKYRIGLWVRDDTQGIGTITYATKDGKFGALGHGITDVDTKDLMDISDGEIYKTKILEIIKGKSGKPGEISGVIVPSKDNKIGEINENTSFGVFGTLSKSYLNSLDKVAYPIAYRQDIKIGDAIVRSTLEGETHDYQIKIVKIYRNSIDNKSMIIEIVDERLLGITNGIVQGMSGSPIIQDGKLIGAITHVFIQDSKRGYATFIENMIK